MTKDFILSILLFFTIINLAQAEGTREVAPNESINVFGTITTDLAALHIGNDRYGNFANYDEPANSARLNVRIVDPTTECLLIGFSAATENGGFPALVRFRFYIRDPNGQLVYSSGNVDNNNAQIDNYQEAVLGPQPLKGAGGYDAVSVTSADLTSQGWTGEGDFYIEFERRGFGGGSFFIPLWDVTVVDCGVMPNLEKTGRVWSEEWSFFSPALPQNLNDPFVRPFNGKFFIVAPDPDDVGAGFVTQMDFNGSGFRAAAFTVALNSFGASDISTLQQNRRSIYEQNSIIGEYPVFLNDPVDLFRTAELGELQFLGTSGCLPDNYCFRAISTEVGEVEIFLDLDKNDGVYSPNTRDVLVNYIFDQNNINTEVCVPWDGLDGLGEEFEGVDFDSFTVTTSFRQGIFHFPVFDVEINMNGFKLAAVRPAGLDPVMYYDDSQIPHLSNTGSPNQNLTGCKTPCHTWTGSTQGRSYGNDNTINSWWYSRTLIDQARVILKFNKSLDTDVSFCAGEAVSVGDSTISSSGLHTFYYGTAAGCDSVVNITAHEVDFAAEVQSDVTELNCISPSIELNGAFSRPFGSLTYSWTVPDSQFISDLARPIISINTPGTYILDIMENTVGCTDQFTLEITEDFTAPDVLFVESYALPCYNIDLELEASVANTTSLSVMWSTSDGLIVSNADRLNPIVNGPGTYQITAIDINTGCESIDEIVVLRDTMTYLTVLSDNEIMSNFCDLTTLSISLNTNTYDSIRWTPEAQLSCSDCTNPDWFADRDGQFQVVVTDTNGCKAQTTFDVIVNEDFKLFIPNAFTPNNDGINDRFSLFSSTCEVDIVEFSVFDRWGEKVFERTNFKSTDQDAGWDGTMRDKMVDPGLYLYRVALRTFRDEIVPLQGEVHLTR